LIPEALPAPAPDLSAFCAIPRQSMGLGSPGELALVPLDGPVSLDVAAPGPTGGGAAVTGVVPLVVEGSSGGSIAREAEPFDDIRGIDVSTGDVGSVEGKALAIGAASCAACVPRVRLSIGS
jgi:hypothetical protein